jgi:acyl-CoA synthetase (AMP-forming)/AMP-acid ligase II
MTVTGLLTIRDILFNGDQDPADNAIESPGCDPLTYRNLRLKVLYVVKTLNSRGFRRNDRIAVIMPPGPETAVIIISVMAGFTVVPLNPHQRKEEYETLFSQLRLQAVIIQKGYCTEATAAAESASIPAFILIPSTGRAGEFALEPDRGWEAAEPVFALPSDCSNILLTSGTTAQPKILTNTQKKLCADRQKQVIPLKITRTDRCLHIVPYYHGMGLGLPLLSILLAGGTVICIKDFIPPDFLSQLTTLRPTCYTASPALHQGILRELKKAPASRLQPNALRFILSSSMSLPADTGAELESLLGVRVIELYASSEIGTVSINFPPRHGSVGIPVVEHLAILNEEGDPLGPHETGEIVVKEATGLDGYDRIPEGNNTAFTNGWFRTGDMGYLDRDGYLFITGRKKEMINKGGEKISPEEIDTALKKHPGVKDAMTFSITDPVLGEDIGAMVVPENPQVTEPDLRHFLLDSLVYFKVPRKIWFVDKIPRTLTGKPQRHEGTERYS